MYTILGFSAAVPFMMPLNAIKKFHTMPIGDRFVGLLFLFPCKLKQQDSEVLCDAIHNHTVCKMTVLLF